MKKTLLILILFFTSFHLLIANENSRVDCLRALINNTPLNDTTRLAYLCQLAVLLQSSQEGYNVAQELSQEAERMHNDKYRGYGLYYSSIYLYNNSKMDSAADYLEQVIKVAEKEHLWALYFEAFALHINTHIQRQELEYSIDEATIMYNKAKEVNNPEGILSANICLATAYIASERFEKGISALQNAYNEVPEIKNQMVVINLLSLLVSTSQHMGHYDDMYMYLQELEGAFAKHLETYPFSESYNTIYLFLDIHYISYYIATKQPELAKRYVEKAEQYKSSSIFHAYSDIYYDAIADYYFIQKEYDKAIAALDSSMLGLKTIMPKDYYRQLTKKANMLSESGRATEALPIYQESLFAKDSIDRALSGKQMEQIQEMYNVNKLLLEQEQIKHFRQITILIISLFITTLLTLFILRSLSVRRKLKEAENEMREATRMAEEANEIKNLFLSNMSYNIRTPLNNVVGFSQLMAIDPDMEEAQRKEYSAIIKTNSEALLNLVNDVLDLSRLEAGMMKFNLQEYDVITLCQEAIYSARAKEQPITVEFHPEIQEQTIKVDTFRFGQLLVSLLTYPTSCNKPLNITLTVGLDSTKRNIQIKTIGSPIANGEFATQEVIIRNDINSLFLTRFGGIYQVSPDTPEGPVIVFTYPLSISE